MASQDFSTPPVDPATPFGRSDNWHHIEPVSLSDRTVEEIVDYIVKVRTDGTESIVSFHWQPSEVELLLAQLQARSMELDFEIRRFEYDYEGETVYLDITSDTELLDQVQDGLRCFLQNCLNELAADIHNPETRQLTRRIWARNISIIQYEGNICKQADLSFERKARQYIDMSDGQIGAVLILDLQYPDLAGASVSLLVADESGYSNWVQNSQLFYDDDLAQQPNGQLDLYISDFRGYTGLPAALCRPLAREVAAGVSRTPQIILTYERLAAIFRIARANNGSRGPHLRDEDTEEKLSEAAKQQEAELLTETKQFVATEMEQHVAEARTKVEHRVAEAIEDALHGLRNKRDGLVTAMMEERKARKRAELDRYVTAEMERYARECARVERRIAEGADGDLEGIRGEMERQAFAEMERRMI
ncbi:hypothetical protein B0I37DRAFT_446234 [Chaetomium sp. MPI-CAGE-AT-0009]|nr:hypothetical protein B0I37DRAFT_446234 [Chaetomium sp. MPI-CAGE-AT-0009]